MVIIDLLRHRYIRTGDSILLYHGDEAKPQGPFRVTVEGWGKYAAVRVGQGAIRRDIIRKDKNGNWFYRYDSDVG